METKQKLSPEADKAKNWMQTYARFSTMAFQMVAVILIGVFLGYKLDKVFHMNKHVFLVLFSFLFMFIALFIMLRNIQRLK
jgi:F0F1-type ATP synthase assembly protein I